MYTSAQMKADIPALQKYAAEPADESYVQEPTEAQQLAGCAPLDLLPAQWWNYYNQKFTELENNVRKHCTQIMDELAALLAALGQTVDGTATVQLGNAMTEKLNTYVPKLADEEDVPVKIQQNDTGSAGTSAKAARADHAHPVQKATASTYGITRLGDIPTSDPGRNGCIWIET